MRPAAGGQQAVEAKRIQVLGIPVDPVDMAAALERVRAAIASQQACSIFAVNPEKVIAAQRNPPLLRILQNGGLLLPDGIGVVLAGRLLGRAALERVPGADLMARICELAAAKGHKVFLYGAKPAVLVRTQEILCSRYPGLRIVGARHGYMSAEQQEGLVDEINASGAEVLFVALGSPRQEVWMDQVGDRLSVSVRQGVGGSFDAICGDPPRAPLVWRQCNLEWLYRLLSQPSRARRQSALPRFALQVLRQLALGRRSPV